ncbi:MAG: leucyl aminopeptidase [Proteobacteria bacterium]|nr:leucyl aminopeptidase [Pseudomonadota bacterium]MDE3207411.1 leucyl aminopeptidase [Pseudomonadota bacterium]
MEFSIKSGSPEKQRTACVVVGIFESRKLSIAAEQIDRASNGYLGDIMRRGDMDGKLGRTLLLHNVPNTLGDRILLVGLGRERDFSTKSYRKAIGAAIQALHDTGTADATFYLTELPLKKQSTAWKIEQAVIGMFENLYRFDECKSTAEKSRRALKRITLSVPRRNELEMGEAALKRGIAIGRACQLARDLGNRPGNICTPTHLAETAQNLARMLPLKATILERTDMEALKMGALLSVARGSRQDPKLIILEYQGSSSQNKPIVLVGKGVTFDSGGISLKPGEAMDEMKFDMCGAAAVLGTLQAVAELELPLNVIGVIPATENLPDGQASKPGDIVTSLSGKTIEILNTDAEGRLILCDALSYSARFMPDTIIDLATLTGACVIALGHVASALYSNNDALSKELGQAAEAALDPVWPMPLWEEYQEQLKSNFADMANIGGRPAGSVTAACFLSRFTEEMNWAHLDIAGTAWKSGAQKGATGRPVPLLMEFILRRAAEHRDAH